MADQDMLTPGNGSGDPTTGPQAATLAQYVKDLSIENPNSPQVYQWQDQPRVDVQFNINVERASEEVHEVVIKLDVSARSDSGVQFMIELSYAGLFGLRNFPEEALGPFLLVEAPRLLFPFARQIIAESTQNAGFPPLLLDGIDFGAAYLAQLQAQQQQGDGAGQQASDVTPPEDNQSPSA
jgi:preprotein translocase subunit SecB